MEPVSGLDFVRSLRSQTAVEFQKVPVLMLSVDSSSQTLHESIPLGISGYVVKPPNLSSLKTKIEQSLAQ